METAIAFTQVNAASEQVDAESEQVEFWLNLGKKRNTDHDFPPPF